MQTRSGRTASQQPRELAGLIELLCSRGVRSYLEVGARHGDTFYEVMTSLPKGSRGVAIDLPQALWGMDSRKDLEACVAELCDMGYDVEAVFGHSQEVSDSVLHDDFDAVLIDGDHRYHAVMADYACYGRIPLVALHDIDGHGLKYRGEHEVGVPRAWEQLKRTRKSVEFIHCDDGRPMGIGVLMEGL